MSTKIVLSLDDTGELVAFGASGQKHDIPMTVEGLAKLRVLLGDQDRLQQEMESVYFEKKRVEHQHRMIQAQDDIKELF